MSVTQSCPTLCDPMDHSLPGFSAHGLLQARILEWGAIPFSRGIYQTQGLSLVSRIAGEFLKVWATRKAHTGVTHTKACSAQVSSVAQACPSLCDPTGRSTPGLSVHHQLPESTQTHVHWVSDAIQPSHPLSSPSPPAFNLSQHQGLFQWVSSSHQVAKVLEFQLQHQSFQWTPRTDLHYSAVKRNVTNACNNMGES